VNIQASQFFLNVARTVIHRGTAKTKQEHKHCINIGANAATGKRESGDARN
jgi:hypothetical protein